MTRSAWLILVFGGAALLLPADGLSMTMKNNKPSSCSRRDVLAAGFGVASSSLFYPRAADATCLQGDATPECIGVYKEPIPNSSGEDVQMSYGAFRPDRPPVVVLTPTSLQEAVEVLQDQHLAMDGVESLVSAGKLQDAGVQFLRVIPKITVAGRVIAASLPPVKSMLDKVEVSAKSLDEMIGRGMKGKLGASAVAQLTILSELKQVQTALEELTNVASNMKVSIN